MASDNGFRVFNCDPLKLKERQTFAEGGLGHVEMLFRCNYLAFVGGGVRPLYPKNKVVIWDDLRKGPIFSIDSNVPVLGVRLRRDRIIIIAGMMFYFEYLNSDLTI